MPGQSQSHGQRQEASQAAGQQGPVPPSAGPDDMTRKIDQLKQLSDLKAEGVLTGEEFEARKRRLLG
ncbi:SHOCT domain-containing protein [Streptomyces sp. NPDC048514]|uniref:SHOCT domain-containing protein n=1 Tax=Streptomyces sp. NPDC048514 TaxID=3365564 RepID=UPI003721294F